MKTKQEIEKNFGAVLLELYAYYDADFDDEDEYKKNKQIKADLFVLAAEAGSIMDNDLKMEILKVISENTGCQEDVDILNELIAKAIDQGFLTEQDVAEHFSGLPVNRWL